jgi:type I restriction enzyme R subunit
MSIASTMRGDNDLEALTLTAFTESVVEEAALAWLKKVGWWVANGPEIDPG